MKTERPFLDVLVIDDSAVVRQLMTAILASDGGMRVATASDPLIALTKMRQWRPDVIVLDLQLPRMDGMTFLKKIMAEDPIPVVVCSGLAGPGTEIALDALKHGAVDVVTKPKMGVRQFLEDSALTLVDLVRAAGQAKVRPRFAGEILSPAAPAQAQVATPRRHGPPTEVIAIGTSTGGPQALEKLLRSLPCTLPPLLIVQHMPERFTAALARRLDETSALEVKEAEDGDEARLGRALIAPGDRHMILARAPSGLHVRLVDGPLVSRHRPSVDVLFRSVANAAGAAAVGVILTGMGDDGVQGLREMHEVGAHTVAQDEASCVVFGMPRQAIQRGAVDRVVALDELAPLLVERCAAPVG